MNRQFLTWGKMGSRSLKAHNVFPYSQMPDILRAWAMLPCAHVFVENINVSLYLNCVLPFMRIIQKCVELNRV